PRCCADGGRPGTRAPPRPSGQRLPAVPPARCGNLATTRDSVKPRVPGWCRVWAKEGGRNSRGPAVAFRDSLPRTPLQKYSEPTVTQTHVPRGPGAGKRAVLAALLLFG